MSLKRTQQTQGGGERYGGDSNEQSAEMSEKPQHATAAQMARRKIASARKPSGSNRSSRAGTPTAPNQFPQQQSAPSFMSSIGQGQGGGGGGFNFTVAGGDNPFANANQQNGTPPPTFGQNGGSVFGGNNSSFGTSFGGNNNASQPPQQNGFNTSSTSNIFGQSNTNNSTSFSFGQNNQASQPQQNGNTPSTATTETFSFGKPNNESNSFAKTNNSQNTNPFQGFKFAETPKLTQSTPSTSFGGANSQQTNGDKSSATPLFKGFGASQQTNDKPSLFSTSETPKPNTSLFSTETPKPTTGLFGADTLKSTSNLFSGSSLGQPNGTSKPEETPKTSTTSLFSNVQQNGASKGLFGATPPPADERPTTPGGSVLTGLDSSRASTIKTGMFTQNKASETPKSNFFSFNSQGNDGAGETPKPSNTLFSAAKTNGATSNLFGNLSSTTQQTPAKETSNLFGSSTAQQPQQSSAAPALFNLGQSTQSQQDTSMTTPGNTPQKSASLFSQPQPQSQPPASEQTPATSETPAGQGKSLFDRVTFPEQPTAATPKPSFTPSTSMFTPSNNKENEAPVSKNLFEQSQTPSTQQQTSFMPSTSMFSKPAAQATQTPSAAPWLSHTPSAPAAPTTTITPATPQPPATATRPSTASNTMDDRLSAKESETLKHLNDGLMKHLASQDRNADWTSIMEYYLQQAAKIRSKPQPKFDAPATVMKTSATPSTSGLLGQKSLSQTGSSQLAKSSTPSNSNLFGSSSTPKQAPSNSTNWFAAAQTPKQPSQLSKPPATAPVNRKRPGPFTEEDDDEVQERGPATEKRARRDEPINYPKLPENASSASKLMESIINTPKGKDAGAQKDTTTAPPPSFGGFNPSTSSATAASQPAATTSSLAGFKPAASASSSQPTATNASSGGFKPATSTATSSGGFTPANAGPPKFSADGGKSGGFLASFGKQAKRKAMDTDDDYDSDEGEEEWEKKYKEKQDAKRKKLMDESKGTSFVFNAAAAKPSAAASVFSISATPSEASDNEADDDKADGEKAQGSGDNTWKPKTPIKFGTSTSNPESTTPAAPPPAFGNLFGSTPATGNSSLLSVPGSTKPSINFNFASNAASSTGTSRASTPGVTTDGEDSTAGNDDDESQAEPQIEDQAALRPEEMKDEDVVFSCPSATSRKIKTKKDPDAPTGQSRGWQVIGIGPLYVLKNRNTGTARILQKIPPMGTPKMNFPMLAKMNYDVSGKRKQMVQGAFFDHIDEPKTPRVAQYALDVGPEYAEELAKVLNENKPKDKDEE